MKREVIELWDGYLGRYRLDELLGSGGSAQVWRAHDTEADRTVTLKVLASAVTADPEYRRRFEREARVAALLKGPHVLPVRAFGEVQNRLYIETDFVDGLDIESLLEWRGPMAPADAVALITQIASALDEAHAAGLIHRDVKPQNIIVDPEDTAYLIDFGTAFEDGRTGITQSGMFVGTPAYMAPERFSGDSTARSDIYSLGCVLYECLTGQRPFRMRSPAQLMRAHLDAAVPPAAALSPAVPPALDRVITRAMAKDPARRYPSAGEFAVAARSALEAPDSDARTVAFSTRAIAATAGVNRADTLETVAARHGAPDRPVRLGSGAGAARSADATPALDPASAAIPAGDTVRITRRAHFSGSVTAAAVAVVALAAAVIVLFLGAARLTGGTASRNPGTAITTTSVANSPAEERVTSSSSHTEFAPTAAATPEPQAEGTQPPEAAAPPPITAVQVPAAPHGDKPGHGGQDDHGGGPGDHKPGKPKK